MQLPPPPPTQGSNNMTEKDIIDSQVFKALNLLIDQKTEELKYALTEFKDRVDRAYTPSKYGGTRVITRTSYERPRNSNGDIDLAVNISDLFKSCDYYKNTITFLQQEISDISDLKLRLLNDYDFTHGNNSEQHIVFGTPLRENTDM